MVCGCNEFGQCDLAPQKKALYSYTHKFLQAGSVLFHMVPLCCYEVMEVLWSADGTDGTNINNATFHPWRLPRSLQSVIQWSSVTAMSHGCRGTWGLSVTFHLFHQFYFELVHVLRKDFHTPRIPQAGVSYRASPK